ncbi:amidohydrolase family protein [Paenarthrobacter ureafaciens]
MTTETTTDQPNIIYTDAEVIVDSRATPAEAIWIRDGRIAAVGSNEEVQAAAGPDVERRSVAGATIIPGLIDTHPHLLHFSAFLAPLVDLTEVRDHDDIVELIRKKAATTPKGEWIRTTPIGEPHYFQRRSFRHLTEGEMPDRHVLDRASIDHPVIIQAFAPVLPNVIALNSAALSALGIDASTEDRVSNIWIEKDAAGNPTGILRGAVTNYYNTDPFFAELSKLMPPLIQPELAPAALGKAMGMYNGLGITTIYEGHAMDFDHIEAYQMMHAHGALSLRVHLVPELEPAALPGDRPKTDAEIDATLEKALAMRSVHDDWLRIDGITSATYGPCFNGSLAWNEGYLDACGQQDNRAPGSKRSTQPAGIRILRRARPSAKPLCLQPGRTRRTPRHDRRGPCQIQTGSNELDHPTRLPRPRRPGKEIRRARLQHDHQHELHLRQGRHAGGKDRPQGTRSAQPPPTLPRRRPQDSRRNGLGPMQSLRTHAACRDPQDVPQRQNQRRPCPGGHP